MGGGVQLRAEFLRRRNPAGEDDGMTDNDLAKLRNYARRLEFPGSQPVSLSNDNQELLYKHRCARLRRPRHPGCLRERRVPATAELCGLCGGREVTAAALVPPLRSCEVSAENAGLSTASYL